MLSIADIPWLGNFFIRFLCVIWIKGTFYKFTTYTGSKIKTINYENNRLHVVIENKKYRLELSTSQNKSGILKAPEIGKMNKTIKESLDAEIKLILHHKKGARHYWRIQGNMLVLKWLGISITLLIISINLPGDLILQ